MEFRVVNTEDSPRAITVVAINSADRVYTVPCDRMRVGLDLRSSHIVRGNEFRFGIESADECVDTRICLVPHT
jgi:hypothetical protein